MQLLFRRHDHGEGKNVDHTGDEENALIVLKTMILMVVKVASTIMMEPLMRSGDMTCPHGAYILPDLFVQTRCLHSS